MNVDGSLDDCPRLHNGDFGISDRKTAATVTHHRVELVKALAEETDLLRGLIFRFGKRFDIRLKGGNELVERRIEETDGDGHALQSFHKTFEVRLLHRLDGVESAFTLLLILGADHLAELFNSARAEEHMLGTGKTDTFGAKFKRSLRVGGGVGVGADLQSLVLIGKLHDPAEVTAVGVGGNGLDAGVVDQAGGAVQGKLVTLTEDLAGELEVLFFFVHLDIAATGNTASTHTTGNNGCVGGLTATHGKDALRVLHALDIFGRGFQTDENDLLVLLSFPDSVFSGEDDGTGSSARGSRNTLANDVCLVCSGKRGCVKGRVEKHVERLCIDLKQSFLLGDHTFVDKIASDLDSRGSGTLAVTALEHIELAVLDGELHILHISVVVFENVANVDELLVSVGELLRHFGDGHRGTNTRDDVLALRVDKEFAHELLLTGGGVTGEGNAGTGIVVEVTENHRHNVDRGTPAVRDVVVHTIDVCTGVIPAAEHRTDSRVELLDRIFREVLAELLLVLRLELGGKLLEVGGGEVDVVLHALLLLHLIDEGLEVLLADFHNDVGEHLDKPSVRVVDEPLKLRIGVAGDHSRNDLVVQTEVQNGVHHAGHGRSGTRTDGNEKRVGEVAELLAVDLLHLFDVRHDLSHDVVVDEPTILVVLRASLGGNGEALRNGKTDLGHFGKVRSFTAKQLTHGCVAFGEKIDVFFHVKSS